MSDHLFTFIHEGSGLFLTQELSEKKNTSK